MAEAANKSITTTLSSWVSLADVLRHAVTARRAPEADIRSEILDFMRTGKLPHVVERTITYPLRPADVPPLSDPPPMQVEHNQPMPAEVLTLGVAGRGSLNIDWRRSRAVRRAGATWPRIEFEGIRCSREFMLAMWSLNTADVAAVALALAPGFKEWLKIEVERRKSVGDIPTGRGAITRFSKQLAARMKADVQAGKCSELKAHEPRSIENKLREFDLWPA